MRGGGGQKDIGGGKGVHAKVGQDHPTPPHPVDNRILSVCPELLQSSDLQTSVKGVDLPEALIRVSIQTTLTRSQKREKKYKY